ncbi:DUF6973 domain-containing protein [Patiriisocius hiemis]|uniref:DUF6973 domain-containing protein n=1 Tax=Patiriisocius hiemis TaxID=3075604 RepID=A0ABU2YBC9_9FLAO|nr:hypothetical protein [Constantimarinum sp. W242]MDT0555502.1 hypothetical protein [Constantimarinum sp. W242]
MNIWVRIKKLSLRQLSKLAFLFIQNPLKIIPTLKATKHTIKLCDTLYGKSHHRSTKANAFRHAYWNIQICLKTQKITKNEQKSIDFAKKLTDLYEKVTQNEPLDEAMDLHNNKIGRDNYLQVLDKSEQKIIDFVQKLAERAQKVSNLEEMKEIDNLVYLVE